MRQDSDPKARREWHHNIFDLTVDTGSGNPGAIGIDYHTNNQGAISRVTVKSGDGSGVCAFELTRRNVGPTLLEEIRSGGFDFGVRFAGLYNVAIEGAMLEGARVAGLSNAGGVVAARTLRVERSPVAVANTDPSGLINILESTLSGNGAAALAGPGQWLVADVSIAGFAQIHETPTAPPPGRIALWTNKPAAPEEIAPRLAVPQIPTPEDIPADGWADVTAFGAKTDDFDDDSAAIQAALDSGKPGVLLPFSETVESRYLLARPIVVPPSVRRIAGGFSNIFAVPGPEFPGDKITPVIRTKGEGGPLLIDRLVVRIKKDLAGSAVAIGHEASRPLIVRHALLNGFQSAKEGGDLFLVDVAAHASDPQTFDFGAGTKVWAWQLDTEDFTKTKITNRGAALWVLGLKSERPSTVLAQMAGRSEVYGGLFYQHHAMDPATPALLVQGGTLLASFATATGGPQLQPGYQVLLKDATSESPREILTKDSLKRAGAPGLAIVSFVQAPIASPAPAASTPTQATPEP